MTPNLFTTFAERAMLRVEMVEANQEVPWRLTPNARRLLGMLRSHVGRENAAPLGFICERLQLTPREVKDLVQTLRLDFALQIGASRDASGGGYYIGRTEEEMVESTTQMLHQALTMLRVVAAMRGPHAMAELLGQLRLEMEKGGAR